MAWTTPKTWAVNDVLTAADMNTYVRDNMNVVGVPPLARATMTAGPPTIANNAWTTLVLPTRDLDQDPTGSLIYDTASGIFTCRTAGVYQAVAEVRWAANATGGRGLGWSYNAASPPTWSDTQAGNATGTSQGCTSPLVRLAVNDTLRVLAFQSSGAGLALIAGTGPIAIWAQIERVSA